MTSVHRDQVEALRKVSPPFNNYIECMSRAYLTGLSAFVLGFGGAYFGLRIFRNHIPKYGPKVHIPISSVVGGLLAYKFTAQESKVCQAGWMAEEDKHTALSPISEKTVEELEES